MPPPVVIGGGHNGLVAAFYLARAGLKPLVLEGRGEVGGAAVTQEIAPGHRCPTLAHSVGPIAPAVMADMQLQRRVQFIRPDPRVVALAPDGRPLVLSQDPGRTAQAIKAHSPADAERYVPFCNALERVAGVIAPLLEQTPPSLSTPNRHDWWNLLQTGRRFRRLARQDAFRLLRWMPMAVGDLVSEHFELELLRSVIAARGVFGGAAGPWSGGTGASLLLAAASDPVPGGSCVTVKGGPGALTTAMAQAAREAGATIRVDAPVRSVMVVNGRATGVLLADGSEIPADAVISNADPKRTLLELVHPTELDPVAAQRLRNYRMPGTVAKVNLTLGTLPPFTGIANPADLHGRIHVGPTLDYLEKAFDASKYGELPQQPYLDITIPSLADPSLCPPGRHVMSIHVQFAPYALAGGADWPTSGDQLATTVVRTLERYSPGFWNAVEHRQVLTPLDLEETYGFTRGHIHHGEAALDQLFTMRPVLGAAQYATPIERLFLCGAGTHPGPWMTGLSGRNAAREILKRLKE